MTSRQYKITILGGLLWIRERFSFRKYKVGLVSVLVGAVKSSRIKSNRLCF
ncbi:MULTISPECIES: YSIRK-type signal peptide-containing protein [Streptococcus]|uniref:YSIRK-type signal peptide-containing protein n=1 Tax=Streptococcus gallolyticus TaxID=315405 RepID=A0AAE6YQJ1_9STRE|nr:YSIRK-type signal peptide-containing protein [Streptococcus gallolyticus]